MRQVSSLLLVMSIIACSAFLPSRGNGGEEQLPIHVLGFGTMESAAASADGSVWVTGGSSGLAFLRDGDSGNVIRTFHGHTRKINAIAISADGGRFLTGSDDQTARLWDTETGTTIHTFGGHGDPVISVGFSSDATVGMTATQYQSVHIWNLATGEELRTLPGHPEWLLTAVLSADGTRVLTGGGDRTARLWDAATGATLQTFSGHADGVYCVAISPTGNHVLTGSSFDPPRIWNANTGGLVHVLEEGAAWLEVAAFSPDGAYVATGGYDAKVRVWNVATGQLVRTLSGHEDRIRSISFSPDGSLIYTGGRDPILRAWNRASGNLVRQIETGHTTYLPSLAMHHVESLAFSPDGKKLIVGAHSSATPLQLWDVESGDLIRTFPQDWGVYSASFSLDGSRVLSTGEAGAVRIWNTQTGGLIRTVSLRPGRIATAAAFSADAGYIVAGYDHLGEIALWNASTGELHYSFDAGAMVITSLALSPDNTLLLTAGTSGEVHLWNAHTAEHLRMLHSRTGPIYEATFSPDARRLVMVGHHPFVKVHETITGDLLLEFPSPTQESGGTKCVAYSPDGSRLVAGTSRMGLYWDEIRLWNAATGERVHTIATHASDITTIAYSPDGTIIASGSHDGTVRLWDALAMDPPPPSISITSPASDLNLEAGMNALGFHGTANAPHSTVALVEWRLNNGAWRPADGLEEWTFEAGPLRSGTNMVEVRSINARGRESDIIDRIIVLEGITVWVVQ